MMLRGKAKWAKVVGKPQKGYNPGELDKEWSIDVYIDKPTVDRLIREGVPKKTIKRDDDNNPYVTFKRKAYKTDPKSTSSPKARSLDLPAQPIRIVDRAGKDWNGDLIGNDSVVNIKYALNDMPDNTKKPSIIAIQVWEHVPFERAGGGDDDFPIDENGAESWD